MAAGAVAQGPPDCEPEDLPLLTEVEKARCRNQIDAERARRLARDADARTAKEVARAQNALPIDPIPAEKRAAYDAAAQANAQLNGPPLTSGPPMARGGSRIGVGVTCSHVNIPLLSGVETNPNLFAKKHKQERPSHGPSPCSAGLR